MLYSQARLVPLLTLPSEVLLSLLVLLVKGVHLCSNVPSVAARTYVRVMAVSDSSVSLPADPMSCFLIHSMASSSYSTAPLVAHPYPWTYSMVLREDLIARFGGEKNHLLMCCWRAICVVLRKT